MNFNERFLNDPYNTAVYYPDKDTYMSIEAIDEINPDDIYDADITRIEEVLHDLNHKYSKLEYSVDVKNQVLELCCQLEKHLKNLSDIYDYNVKNYKDHDIDEFYKSNITNLTIKIYDIINHIKTSYAKYDKYTLETTASILTNQQHIKQHPKPSNKSDKPPDKTKTTFPDKPGQSAQIQPPKKHIKMHNRLDSMNLDLFDIDDYMKSLQDFNSLEKSNLSHPIVNNNIRQKLLNNSDSSN